MFKSPPDGIVFLAVPDTVIEDVATRLAATGPPAEVSFVHLSGAMTLEVLAPLRGHAVGSFHPLQSFPFPREPEAFRGITIAVDASTPTLLRKLRSLARQLGARPRKVAAGERVLYHAAAVYASNFVVASFGEGVRQLERIGWSKEDATRALLPLLDGVVANLRRKGVQKAMTGPIRRGDAETVRRHLEALDRPDAYRILGSIALDIARQAGLDPAAAERVRRALTRDVAATRRRRRR
ncbi:MAG TPA: DUF2520 domain-containing protein [Candidatus Dormibacteraeota bacterium]|nr:DUF2520 domain-containing protein [Candidatus Dormibacteraeota bacterium]